jgi:autoinducer 2 (AI-2) kinase
VKILKHYLVIDCGTGSGRTILFDEGGNEIAMSQREWKHMNYSNVAGAIDFDTKTNWPLIKEIIKETIEKSGVDRETIVAISASSMREGMVLYNESGEEIWACSNIDARAGIEVEELIATGLEMAIYNHTGQTFSLSDAPRLLWVKKNLPEVYEAAHKLGMISDWVLFRLCGQYTIEPTNGSTSGIFDTFTRQWNDEIITKLNLKENIYPVVHEPGDIIGTISEELASEFNLSPNTKVIVGGGDVQLGTIGVGAVKENDAVIFGGTFWQQEVNVKNPVPDKNARVRINSHGIKELFQYEGIAFQVGLVMRWFRDALCQSEKKMADELGISTYSLLTEMSKSVPVGSYGIIPIFSDIMNYMHWKHSTPAFIGMNINEPEKYNKAAMFKSLMENAAFLSLGNLKLIQEITGFFPENITFGGGASYSPEWCKILANVLGIPVKVPKVKEATSFGVLLTCLVGTGEYKSFEEAAETLCSTEAVYYPDRAAHKEYKYYYRKWKDVYQKMLNITDTENLNHMWKAPGE